MATVNIIVTVDGASLATSGLGKGTTSTSPYNLGSYSTSDVYISMVAPNGSVVNNQGLSELTIDANSGDSVEWAITTFDNNFDQTPYLYSGSFNPSAAITALSFASSQAYAYLGTGNPPSTSNPTKFINQVNTASGTIQQVNVQIQYTLSFVLVNNANGSIIGYFTWDPFIKVN